MDFNCKVSTIMGIHTMKYKKMQPFPGVFIWTKSIIGHISLISSNCVFMATKIK